MIVGTHELLSRWIGRGVLTLSMSLPLACASKEVAPGPSSADIEAFQNAVEASKHAPPEDRTRALVRGCLEIAGCPGPCKDALNAYVYANPAERMAQMSSCEPLVKAYENGSSSDADIDAYMLGVVKRYADRAGVSLPPL